MQVSVDDYASNLKKIVSTLKVCGACSTQSIICMTGASSLAPALPYERR